MKKISIQISSVAFLVLVISATAQQSPENRLPNIVYIFADDLGYGDIGSFGAKDIQTPHIDRLATEGIKFLNFYSASPLCSPSRAAFLTGRYPQRMGINDVFFPESFTGTPEEEITIFEILAERERKALNSRSIEIDGSTLEYTIEGEGIPCLVIGSSIYYPRTFPDKLRLHLKMYFVDMKWFAKGYAKEDLNQVTIETIVEDIEQIREALGLKMPLIMGHSIHGTMATEYVKKYGDKVSGLIVIGSPSEWGNATYQEKATALWETASAHRKALQEKNWGQTNEIDRLTGQKEAVARYNNMAPQYWYDPEYDAGWLWKDMTVHSEVTQHIFTKVFLDYNMFDPPVPINVPMFVGLGKYDYVIPYTLWRPLYERIRDFKLIIFEKSGHTPQLEEPEAFSEALIDWLNKPKS